MGEIKAVYLSLLLYMLYVLLPMIPAITIYRIFPSTQVGVKGPLGKLTINATGAFAAYIITVSLGYFLVQHTQSLINAVAHPPSIAWDVTMETVVLKDETGSKIIDNRLLDSIQVLLEPSPDHVSNGRVYFNLPSKDYKIHLNVPQFGEETFFITDDHIETEENLSNHKLTVTSPIEITGYSSPYNP